MTYKNWINESKQDAMLRASSIFGMTSHIKDASCLL